MSKEIAKAERAELIQSVLALFIPLVLFLSVVVLAAGMFLIYNEESVGWAFIGVAATMALGSIISLIKFQNKLRARGVVPQDPNDVK